MVNATLFYYAVDNIKNVVIIFDETWSPKSFYNLSFSPAYIKQVENELFFTSNMSLIRTTLTGTLLSQCFSNGLFYRGIYYNESSQLLYVAGYDGINGGSIDLFNRNLTLLRQISLASRSAYSVEGFGNRLYVGAFQGNISSIIIFENETLIKSFSTSKCSGIINGLVFDNDGYIGISCYLKSYLFLYHSNGTYKNKSILISGGSLTSLIFDALKRMIVIAATTIRIYSEI